MKSKSIFAAVLLAGLTQAQVKWNVDASHSKLGFSVTHLMVSETEGKFKIYKDLLSQNQKTILLIVKLNFQQM